MRQASTGSLTPCKLVLPQLSIPGVVPSLSPLMLMPVLAESRGFRGAVGGGDRRGGISSALCVTWAF